MEKLQKRLHDTIKRSLIALGRYTLEGPHLAAAQRRLQAAEREISTWGQAQAIAQDFAGTDGGEIRKLRHLLRHDHMIPIVRFGKKVFRWEPEMAGALNVPHTRANSDVMVTSAKRLAKALKTKARQKLYLQEGFDEQFVANLIAAADAVAERSKHDDTWKRKRVEATWNLRQALRDAREELRIMDGLLLASTRTNQKLATFWKREKRLMGKVGRPPKKRGAPPPPHSG
jgi:hypothetical protein